MIRGLGASEGTSFIEPSEPFTGQGNLVWLGQFLKTINQTDPV